jgi:preprotein translocase subunit YajC
MEPSILLLQAQSQDMLRMLMPFLLIGVVFYLLVFMPMKKKQKKMEAFIAALKNGDKVITNSGIYGVIAGVKDKSFVLKISDQVKIEVTKNAIAGPQAEDNP